MKFFKKSQVKEAKDLKETNVILPKSDISMSVEEALELLDDKLFNAESAKIKKNEDDKKDKKDKMIDELKKQMSEMKKENEEMKKNMKDMTENMSEDDEDYKKENEEDEEDAKKENMDDEPKKAKFAEPKTANMEDDEEDKKDNEEDEEKMSDKKKNRSFRSYKRRANLKDNSQQKPVVLVDPYALGKKLY